ncbi:hypothetical protein A3752_23405 [Oleiphilus sp. HI0081]|jgi:hypothetical protein|uniref:hypothetical protein n=2 Tax=Oleiphilus TaxID=141450 RepID=UPI0007C22635|nr:MULTISPECIES: hypothetical protein [unclassified Oleiphilus]KZY75610.1 hypothetical protein A3741_11755 [Oleiphilus sp. HI0069]KZY84144.1 hypothetical protein A3740_04730 [Oleiphilus sp. HI0068]KZY95064.1 hypothetical protein A3743_05730 [Oleiphilus sp. HI0072]KZZ11849.1 hypothetical protein A3749_07855 [Oleiphilus sp. HI0078]KZZ23059.1 hypothetical protein A3752_00610 [Oleiphilus sp. HI0081]KZZ41913.1 hypothetical protein A3755_22825 [Oleiphilus sp. HI0085]
MDEQDINRLMLHYEQLYRKSNREIINPEIEALSTSDLKPIVNIVAQSRAAYLKFMYELGKKYDDLDDSPSAEELKKLKTLRLRFEELAEGAKAFETSIQKGYLDLKTN